MEEKKRIKSNKLLGLDAIHEEHRDRADMHSTGFLVHSLGDLQRSISWTIEYRCDVCGHNVLYWNFENDGLIREILTDNGIIKGKQAG